MTDTKKDKVEKKIDHLTEDPPIPGQQWVCLSFLSPEGIKNCNIRGIKVRGVFGTKEEAEKRAEYLSKTDPNFDVFVGEVGKWLPWNPDPNDVQDQKYQEEELQKIMEELKNNQEKAKRMQEQRKRDMIDNAAYEEQSNQPNSDMRLDQVKSRLRKKLEEKKAKQNVEKIVDKQLEDDENKVKEEKKNLDEMEKTLSEKKANLENLDDKLSKIQELYKKLNKKLVS